MPPVAEPFAVALTAAAREQQLAVQAQRYALADYALKVIGLVRPSGDNEPEEQCTDFSVDEDTLTQMKDVVRTRGVKQRLEDDFDLKIGVGDDVAEKESEVDFLNRTILQLRKENVNDVIKLFNRVEKNNRKAVATDAAFLAQRDIYAKKVAEDDAEEKFEDDEYGTYHRGSAEEYALFEDWCQQFEYREGEGDFSCFAGSGVTRGDRIMPDDGTFAGYDLVKIRDALHYFKDNSLPVPAEINRDATSGAAAVKSEPAKPGRPDPNVVKAELAKWSPAFVVSSYRRLSLVKHPDKEGGSLEAFQELTDHTKVLTEACAKFHGISIKKALSRKQKKCEAADTQAVAKMAICAEFPVHLKTAVYFFYLTEERFRFSNILEIKKTRQLLDAGKDRRDRQIKKADKPEQLLDFIREAQESPDDQAEDLGKKNLKQLKTLCTSLCKAHYANVYGHIQKLK